MGLITAEASADDEMELVSCRAETFTALTHTDCSPDARNTLPLTRAASKLLINQFNGSPFIYTANGFIS